MNRPLTYPNCCFNHFAEVMDPLNLNCAKTARAAKIESTLDEYEDENALLYFRELSDLYNISASTLQRLGTIKNCAKYQLNFSYFFTILCSSNFMGIKYTTTADRNNLEVPFISYYCSLNISNYFIDTFSVDDATTYLLLLLLTKNISILTFTFLEHYEYK